MSIKIYSSHYCGSIFAITAATRAEPKKPKTTLTVFETLGVVHQPIASVR
jgi:predicted adenine nucleotide alpha hydrolase (AANH) superfamily ATPase